jgi:hypothetical protein
MLTYLIIIFTIFLTLIKLVVFVNRTVLPYILEIYFNFDKIRYISKRTLARFSQKLLFSALVTDYKAYLTKVHIIDISVHSMNSFTDFVSSRYCAILCL